MLPDDRHRTPDEYESALRIQAEQYPYFQQRALEDLGSIWTYLTGEDPGPSVKLALADLLPWHGLYRIERALYIAAYRNHFSPPIDGIDGHQVVISVWAVRQLLEEWAADGRFGLGG